MVLVKSKNLTEVVVTKSLQPPLGIVALGSNFSRLPELQSLRRLGRWYWHSGTAKIWIPVGKVSVKLVPVTATPDELPTSISKTDGTPPVTNTGLKDLFKLILGEIFDKLAVTVAVLLNPWSLLILPTGMALLQGPVPLSDDIKSKFTTAA